MSASRRPNQGKTYAVDFASTGLGGKHTENASAAADVEDDLAAEQVLVLHDRVHVGLGANLVLQHLFVNACK